MREQAKAARQCEHVAEGFVEVMGDGSMWVLFAGQRMVYTVMQGKLKSIVHSVMV